MKVWVWKPEKNEKLVENERPSFEEVLAAIREGGIRDIQTNANYPKQFLLIVFVDKYAHAVPIKVEESVIWMFTVYPSRKFQKQYGGQKK